MITKLTTLLISVVAVSCVELQIKNNSPDTPVFVQILGTINPDPFTLKAGGERNLSYNKPWSGRIWGRVDCYTLNQCIHPIPASLAEITVTLDKTLYDISLVDGFNIPVSIEPIGREGDGSAYSCQQAECAFNILDECPEELKLFNTEDTLVSCRAACKAFNDDLYCCRGAHNTPDTCKSSDWPVDYASFFKTRCPDAYSYAYDDRLSTFTCEANKYVISFF